MESSARLYNCVRCHRQVVICSACDHGNIYCGRSCAQTARRHSQRAAGRRYQQTYRGRLKHAQRQRRYRARGEKVTHQGSVEPAANDPLITRSDTPVVEGHPEQVLRCHFCGRPCGPFLRRDYLHRWPLAGRSERVPVSVLSDVRAQAP